MAEAINQPRGAISDWAPRITTIKIPVERIKDIIGPGGKIIRGMQMETGAKIDVEDDGTVHVAAVDGAAGDKALSMIKELTQDVEEGAVYEGTVVKIMDFGAFVEILPGRDGLVHISELDHHQGARSVTDVLKEGDKVKVKVLGVDDRGKVRLSRKALLPPPEGGYQGGPTTVRPAARLRLPRRDQYDVVNKTTLDNGVRLVTERLPHAYSVTAGLWMEVGSRDEEPAQGGISHFIEHMAFKGTARRDALAIARELDRLGGMANAFTSKETTCFHARTLPSTLAPSPICSPTSSCIRPTTPEVERERQVILQEISAVEDTPDELVHVLFGQNYWGEHPLGRPVLGSSESVGALSRQDMVDYLASATPRPTWWWRRWARLSTNKSWTCWVPALAELPILPPREARQTPASNSQDWPGGAPRQCEQVHIAMGAPAPRPPTPTALPPPCST